jgi:deoxyribodipyrimidine photo-lyase
MERFSTEMITEERSSALLKNLVRIENSKSPHNLSQIGFTRSRQRVKPVKTDHNIIINYASRRDFPELEGTTGLGPHLRFGTISIREVFRKSEGLSSVFTSELIWREFFMHILYLFPHVVEKSFSPEYDHIMWINNEEHFHKWCTGMTGYPFVDAGMRELNATGSMHNRVRMVTASFLVKHLLCDWRWGEAWFASKLHDFELSSNNGNWQWAAGTGCDAAPYFRIFSPDAQQKRFDPRFAYIKKWVPEYGTAAYPAPIVNHAEARERALRTYKTGLER